MKKILCFAILAITIGCQRVPEESCMAIEFTSGSQVINYGTSTNANDLTVMTISYWAKPAGTDPLDVILHKSNGTNAGWTVYETDTTSLRFSQLFDGGGGVWEVTSAVTAGTRYHGLVTYDATNTANDPTIYINTTPQVISELTTPSGSLLSDAGVSLGLGNRVSSPTIAYEGQLQDIRIYNRILSASEIAELYNSRCQRVVMDGLVFWAPMDGAAGLSSFDGATLSSANTIIDRISGVQGVPSGSPIGRGNTIQRIY